MPEAVGERVVVDLLDQVRVPGAVAEHPFGVRLAEVPDGGGADVGLGVAIDVRGERGGAGCLHPDRQLRLHAGVLAQAHERVVLDLGSGIGRARGADVDPVGAARVVDEVALDRHARGGVRLVDHDRCPAIRQSRAERDSLPGREQRQHERLHHKPGLT